jgi:hypothetical protein
MPFNGEQTCDAISTVEVGERVGVIESVMVVVTVAVSGTRVGDGRGCVASVVQPEARRRKKLQTKQNKTLMIFIDLL